MCLLPHLHLICFLLYLHVDITLHNINILYIPGHMVLKTTTKDLGTAKNVGKGGFVVTELEDNSEVRLWVVIPGGSEI